MATPKPGDTVTYWLVAENCLCENNGHPPVPTLEMPEEPAIVRTARGKLRAEREFDDDLTLRERHPEAADALDAHHAAHQERSVAHAKAWVEKHHPAHRYADLVALRTNHAHTMTEEQVFARCGDLFSPRARSTHGLTEEQIETRRAELLATARKHVLSELDLHGPEMDCGHLRTLTGYPATVVGRVVDIDPETGVRQVYYQLEVDFPKTIMGKTRKRELGYLRRQNHCVLAEGRRPESGEFTLGGSS